MGTKYGHQRKHFRTSPKSRKPYRAGRGSSLIRDPITWSRASGNGLKDPTLLRKQVEYDAIASYYKRPHVVHRGKGSGYGHSLTKSRKSKFDNVLRAKLPNLHDTSNLRGFSGSELFYKHPIGNILYTDGVKYIADKYGAYWLIDAVGSYQSGRIRSIPFQIWELHSHNGLAVLTMKEDRPFIPVVRQNISFTDFPTGRLKLYLVNGTLMLPSEY